MAEEVGYELVDRDYGEVRREGSPRQIRTKKESFASIFGWWTKFRISFLNGRLEAMKDSALSANYTQENFEKKIEKKAKAIAKVEEKIKILSREDVPTDYVSRRAIKLKKKMISGLSYNCGNYYKISITNPESVFDEGIEEKVEPKVDAKPSEVTPQPVVEETGEEKLDRKDIESAIGQSFNELGEKNTGSEAQAETPPVGGDDGKNPATEGETPVVEGEGNGVVLPEDEGLSRDELKDAIDQAFKDLEQHEEPVIIDTQDAEQTDEDTAKFQKAVEDTVKKIRVSRNGSASTKAERFDRNGQKVGKKKKYDYVPMTDEEIRESQIKLGFDEHGNIVDTGKRVFDEPVVENAKILNNYSPEFNVPKVSFSDVFVPSPTAFKSKEVADVDREMPVIPEDRRAAFQVEEKDDDGTLFEIIRDPEGVPEDNQPVEVREKVEAKVVDEPHELPPAASLEDYTALKERLNVLRARIRAAEQRKADAEREKVQVAQIAESAKENSEQTQRTLNETLARLREYVGQVEGEFSRIEGEADASVDALENERRKVDKYQQKTTSDNQRILEIMSLMEIPRDKSLVVVDDNRGNRTK